MPSTQQDILSFEIDPGSFKDPSGFAFQHNNHIYRAIAPSYFSNYDHLMGSGLYASLIGHKYMIGHTETNNFLSPTFADYKIIKPEQIPFITYPYEWCFSELKQAALLTLSVQKLALKHGMILKDATTFNIQFSGNRPVFIDTLSFEKYNEGVPWIAYHQFCQHFLSSLTLMAYKHEGLLKLSQIFLDGIPLELSSTLLTRRSYLNSGIASHLHIHSKIRQKTTKKKKTEKKIVVSKKQLLYIVEHLEQTIKGLKIKRKKSQWNKYPLENSYSKNAKEEKSKIISIWLKSIAPETIWDMGCNTGYYSLLASAFCEHLIAMDEDHLCIESLYHSLSNSKTTNILPLVIDLANPTPAIGWENQERKSLLQRGTPHLVMALALLHHLRITNNIPLDKIAKSFSKMGTWLIIEFIPKNDIQIQEMLMNRKDIFEDYSLNSFISVFESFFEIKESMLLPDSERVLFLMKRKN